MPCEILFETGGAVAGATIGGAIGAAGGTLVIPGIGTVAGAAGVGLLGAGLGATAAVFWAKRPIYFSQRAAPPVGVTPMNTETN